MFASANAPLSSVSVFDQQRPPRADAYPDHWGWSTFAGRVSEFSGVGASATLTLACRLVLEAQYHAEPVAWITRDTSCFFPPDVASNGVDLEALVVVRVADSRAIAHAADMLLRSGGFGLLVLDLGKHERIPSPLQTRLAALARTHTTGVLLLTQKQPTTPSVSSLVALRGDSQRQHLAPDRFVCTLSIVKDKRWGPSWTHMEVVHGPAGLR